MIVNLDGVASFILEPQNFPFKIIFFLNLNLIQMLVTFLLNF